MHVIDALDLGCDWIATASKAAHRADRRNKGSLQLPSDGSYVVDETACVRLGENGEP